MDSEPLSNGLPRVISGHTIVDKGNTSRNHVIDEKAFSQRTCFFRSGKREKLSEDIRVKHAHDGTGQLVEPSSSSAHSVQEQFVPEENRDIASF